MTGPIAAVPFELSAGPQKEYSAAATRGAEEGPNRLGTDFEFDVGFTFGSVTNNVVNPRMGSGRGRRFF